MNKVILSGNLTADPEVTVTQSGIKKCSFRLAVRRRYANQQGQHEADFINIVVWRQLAGICEKYLKKGSRCGVVGAIQTRDYTAQDGTKRYITEIVADEIELMGSPNRNASGNTEGGFTEVEDPELPF